MLWTDTTTWSSHVTPEFNMTLSGMDVRVAGSFLKIGRLAAEKFDFLDDPPGALAQLRAARARIDIFTFLQRPTHNSPEHAYPMVWDNFALLRISTYDSWWTEQLDNKTRNMVRRAEKKGVSVREVPFDDDLVRGIWTIYNETPVRQGKPFPHYGKDVATVRREAATFLDRSVFVGAFLEEELIGFLKLTPDQGFTQAGIMNIVGLVRQRDKAPMNALIAQAVRTCADRGVPSLTYANFAYGNKQRDTLAEFKRNNGFERVDVPRYYVPLTRVGEVAFRLGLHRKLRDRIPERVMSRLRNARSAWYERPAHGMMIGGHR